MIWLGPLTTRETVAHVENNACRDHCHSCDVDEPGHALIRCYECGHAYRTEGELRSLYLAESPWHWLSSWHWWRVRFASTKALDRLITFCPLCLHDF